MNNNKQLSDFDIGVILIIKKHHGNLNKIRDDIAVLGHDFYLLDEDYFDMKVVSDKIITAFIDFVCCSKHVFNNLRLFFRWKDLDKTDVEACANVLLLCSIREFNAFENRYEYANGFHDFEFEKLDLSLSL